MEWEARFTWPTNRSVRSDFSNSVIWTRASNFSFTSNDFALSRNLRLFGLRKLRRADFFDFGGVNLPHDGLSRAHLCSSMSGHEALTWLSRLSILCFVRCIVLMLFDGVLSSFWISFQILVKDAR